MRLRHREQAGQAAGQLVVLWQGGHEGGCECVWWGRALMPRLEPLLFGCLLPTRRLARKRCCSDALLRLDGEREPLSSVKQQQRGVPRLLHPVALPDLEVVALAAVLVRELPAALPGQARTLATPKTTVMLLQVQLRLLATTRRL